MTVSGCIRPVDAAALATGTPALPQILRDVGRHFAGLVIVNGGIDLADAGGWWPKDSRTPSLLVACSSLPRLPGP